MWVTLKDDESALQAIKMGGYVCIYWASFYLFDLIHLKNYPISSHYLITLINFCVFILIMKWFVILFYKLIDFQYLSNYPVLIIFGVVVNIILFGTFVWLSIDIIRKKRSKFIPWVCAWTWFHLVLKIFSSQPLEWISCTILFILSINAWRGWRFYQKREVTLA